MQQSRSDEFSGLMWGIISDAFKYSNETSAISPNRSLKDFFAEEVSNKEMSKEDKKVLLQMAEIWGGFIGDHVEHQSLKYFFLEECIDGGKLRFSQEFCCVDLTESREPLPLKYLQSNLSPNRA